MQHNKISIDIINENIVTNITDYFESLKTHNFSDLRTYIANLTIDPKTFYGYIFKNLENYFKKDSIPSAILLLAKYQYESSMSIDQEIPLVACSIELMDLEFLN